MSEVEQPQQRESLETTAAELLRRIREARQMADEALRKASEALSQGERLRQ